MRPASLINICGHTAEVAAHLRLRLTIQIQKLQYIIKLQIFELQIWIVIKQIFILCQQQTCLFTFNLLSYELLTAPTALIEKVLEKFHYKFC